MAKVNIKSEKLTPFGEIYYASKAFYALLLDKVINGTLGVRSSTYNGYQWDETMSAIFDVFLCGGDCVEDVIRTVDGNCRIFYIRAIHSASMYSRIQDIREWRRVEIGSQETGTVKRKALSKRTTSVGRESATSTISTMISDGSIYH